MGTLLWPNGSSSIPTVTSEYGPRDSIGTPGGATSSYHRGIDLVGFSTVRSPVDGIARFTAYNGGFGNLVIVREDGTGDEFYLAHNARFLVGAGTRVAAGDPVAIQGTTGASTGVHTHEEVHPGGGAAVNPRTYYAARQGGSPAGGGASPFNPTESDLDMRTIHSPNRPWANVGAGAYFPISDEAAANTIWPKIELNDRQYDLAVEASARAVATQPRGGMLTIADNVGDRPVALIGPGYFRALNDEERQNVGALADRHVVGNTRQYDLWVSMALAGQGASFPIAPAALAALSDEDVKRLAKASADELKARLAS